LKHLRFPLALLASLVGGIMLLPLLLLATPFVTVGLATRLLAWILEPRFSVWQNLIDFDPRLGWKPKVNLDTAHRVDAVYRLTTDSDGWRGKHRIEDCDILVMGDSFAWGYATDDRHFFADVSRKYRIKSVGTIGYNLVQELILMKELASRLRGKVVIWFVYYGNDLYDNLKPHMYGYRTPFVSQSKPGGGWEIVSDHVSRSRWFFRPPGSTHDGGTYIDKVIETCAPTFFANRAFSACRYLLHEGREVCRSAGAQLAIVSIPEKIQYSTSKMQRLAPVAISSQLDPDYPDLRLGAICADLGLPFLALKQHMDLRHYRETDCHWNEHGHRRTAEIIAEFYQDIRKVTSEPDLASAHTPTLGWVRGAHPNANLNHHAVWGDQ
jgi:hypothetical protein